MKDGNDGVSLVKGVAVLTIFSGFGILILPRVFSIVGANFTGLPPKALITMGLVSILGGGLTLCINRKPEIK